MKYSNRTQLGIRVPNKLDYALRLDAEEHGMTLNAYVVRILWDYIEKKGEKTCINSSTLSQ